MKNERELEAILRKMPLQHVPVDLDDRVLRMAPTRPERFAAARPERRGWVFGLVTMGGLAACIALMSMTMREAFHPDRAEGDYATDGGLLASQRDSEGGDKDVGALGQVRIEQRWSSVVEGGLVTTDEDVALRQWRVRDLVRTVWVDGAGKVKIEVTVPREQILLVPAAVF